MIFTHNHRIDLNDKQVVQTLIASGQLVPTRERVSGLTGQVYAPTPGLAEQLRPLDHSTLAAGPHRLKVQLHRMPEAELVALQAHPNASDFQQHDVVRLLPLLLRSRTKADEKTLTDGVIAALKVGPQRCVPALVDDIWSGSVWLPEASRVVVKDGLPFLMLAFDVPISRPDDVDTVRCAVGLDIGLSPVITVATASGYVNSGGSVYPFTRSEYGTICRAAAKLGVAREVVEQLLLLLTYAAARAHLEFVTLCLQEMASVVYVERIDYTSFASDFAARGRELATIDFLSGWLAQRMHACQIAVRRVEPGYTSQICSYCHLRGTRDGAVFTCRQCRKEVDAHANAARVILASGMASTLRRLHGRN